MDFTRPAGEIRMACLHCGFEWDAEAIEETDTGWYGPKDVDCPTCEREGTPYDNLTSSERFKLQTLRMAPWQLRELKEDMEADDALSDGY